MHRLNKLPDVLVNKFQFANLQKFCNYVLYFTAVSIYIICSARQALSL